MFNILKNKKKSETLEIAQKDGFLTRLKASLSKTRTSLVNGLTNLALGQKTLDLSVLEEIETLLLTADVGIEATNDFIQNLTQQLSRKELSNTKAAIHSLQMQMKAALKSCEASFPALHEKAKPFVILTVGINGAGKTTTIGKLTHYLQLKNRKILLAAGDTFRAAAIEQLQIWGERNKIPVIAQQQGADSAAVIFDAANAAKARDIDILIADTAGRLHTQSHLMEELKKIKRVLTKFDISAPQEILLVLDASIGQNALLQAKQFHEAIGVTGLIITKLDGSAKGGVIFAIAKQFALPIYFVGIGESLDDLKPFNAEEFVTALFAEN